MKIYIEQTPNSKNYGLLDVEIKEDVILTDRTIYQQEMTAIFKGFTTSITVDATPNNIKLFGYFGNIDLLNPPAKTRNAKIYINETLYKTGTITIENVAYKNNSPSVFQFSFSDGQKNLSQLIGEDTLDSLAIGDTTANIPYSSINVYNALGSGIQSSDSGFKWIMPLVSTERIFIVDEENPNGSDNLVYDVSKPQNSENVLKFEELRPAIFISDILKKIETKYNFSLGIPDYYIPGHVNQLKGLAVHCLSGDVISKPVTAKVTKSTWSSDTFREERFDILIKRNIGGSGVDGFELNYLGYGSGSKHDATFSMHIDLKGTISKEQVNGIEIWQVDTTGNLLKKLNYIVIGGAETKSKSLAVNIGLDVFTPPGQTLPSPAVKPLVVARVSTEPNSEWNRTDFEFRWGSSTWFKDVNDNIQPLLSQQTNLFSLLPKIKIIDFIRSIYTMFGMKSFANKEGAINTINDFWYVPKKANNVVHAPKKVVNEKLSRYADPSNIPKKPNVFYDGYNLKHKTSEYLSSIDFLNNNGVEYGQLKYAPDGKPKNEFLIETEFTAPVLVPIAGSLSELINTFYPFGGEPHLNDTETRFVYDTIRDELPMFYLSGSAALLPAVAYKINGIAELQQIITCNKISHLSPWVRTDDSTIFGVVPNYISSLFGTLESDINEGVFGVSQNTLYKQGYQKYIEGTLSGKRLIHEVNFDLPSNVVVDSFSNSQDVVVGENNFEVLESSISLTTGKSKLTLLNY